MSCKIKGKGKGKIKSRQKENTFSSYQTNNQQPTNQSKVLKYRYTTLVTVRILYLSFFFGRLRVRDGTLRARCGCGRVGRECKKFLESWPLCEV